MERHLIVRRPDGSVCTCGCNGDDPWHEPHYRRVVRAVVRYTEPKPLGDGRFSLACGTARFPWGVERVRLVGYAHPDGTIHENLWEIVP